MPVISSIFLVLALILGITVGPQPQAWSWGPSLLAVALSAAAAVPVFWRNARFAADFGLIAFGSIVAGWFAWRGFTSPVGEPAQTDMMLLAAVVGIFISLRAIEGHKLAEKILIWGIALLLLANVSVMGKQPLDPNFTPIFGSRPYISMSGFFLKYGESANYLIASTLLVAAAALFGRHSLATRIIWLLIAAAGLAVIGIGPSRGGILGAAVGGGVFAAMALMTGKRKQARWFPIALIALPIIAIGIITFLMMGMHNAQQLRQPGSSTEVVLDNGFRLGFLGIALSCIALHPWTGGGSRSFGWECFQYVDAQAQGDVLTHNPELVHNELVEAATDYGLIGAGLLIGLFGALAVIAIVRNLFPTSEQDTDTADTWRIGGMAAFAGMFTQSCFSFVFHLLPGILLLGICLGMISRSSGKEPPRLRLIGSKLFLTLTALICMAWLVPLGWSGVRTSTILWPVYFSKIPLTSAESRIDALTEAIPIWPQASLFKERGNHRYEMASALGGGPELEKTAQLAIADYEAAERLHPYDPAIPVNRAVLLSTLQRDAEAEAAYRRAIEIQGGIEPGYRAHFFFAKHLWQKAVRQFDISDPSAALATMELSAQEMEEAVRKMHWVTADMFETRVTIHENLGATREASGDYKGAMAAYDFAAALQSGGRVHYRAGLLYTKLADAAWSARRPGEALSYFIEAKRRMQLARLLPYGITPTQRAEHYAYLDKSIAYLKGAKVTPLPLPTK